MAICAAAAGGLLFGESAGGPGGLVPAPGSGPGAGAEPHRRADAARNHQRLLDAAAEVFAARGLDATLDDIARHAGVNVATAYRHFANKHELAREFLQQCVEGAVAIAERAAAEPDPWTGLTHFLQQSLEMITSNRALVDVMTRAYGTEHFNEMLSRTSAPLEQLLARAREAGAVRADLAVTDFPAILEMLASITGRGAPGLPHRYIALVLAGMRPGGEPLPGQAPSEEYLRKAAATKRPRPTPLN